jgi:hypothetical protein
MCPHTTICVLILLYVSSYNYIRVLILLNVSSYYYMCVLILLYMRSDTRTVFMMLNMAYMYFRCYSTETRTYPCPHTTICVLILLYLCPHTTTCVLNQASVNPRCWHAQICRSTSMRTHIYSRGHIYIEVCPHTYIHMCPRCWHSNIIEVLV